MMKLTILAALLGFATTAASLGLKYSHVHTSGIGHRADDVTLEQVSVTTSDGQTVPVTAGQSYNVKTNVQFSGSLKVPQGVTVQQVVIDFYQDYLPIPVWSYTVPPGTVTDAGDGYNRVAFSTQLNLLPGTYTVSRAVAKVTTNTGTTELTVQGPLTLVVSL